MQAMRSRGPPGGSGCRRGPRAGWDRSEAARGRDSGPRKPASWPGQVSGPSTSRKRQGDAVRDPVIPRAERSRQRPHSRGSHRARRRGRGRWPLAGSKDGRSAPDGRRPGDSPRGGTSTARPPAGRPRPRVPAGARKTGFPAPAVWIGLNSPRITSGRLGLHVERVVLTQPAAEQDHDHRLRPPGRSRTGRGRPAVPRASPAGPSPAGPSSPTWTNPRRVIRAPAVF